MPRREEDLQGRITEDIDSLPRLSPLRSARRYFDLRRGEVMISANGGAFEPQSPSAGSFKGQALANARAPQIVSIVTGQEDEDMSTVTNSTYAADATNFKLGARAHRMTMAGAVTATMRQDPLVGATDPINIHQGTARGANVCAWVYFDDPTKVTSVTLELWLQTGSTGAWSRDVTIPAAQGWQFMRWPASQSTITTWGTFYACRLVVVTNAATFVTLGHVYVEMREKAQIGFMFDRGYQSAFTYTNSAGVVGGEAQLAALNVPIMIAADPALLGTGTGKDTVITAATLQAIAARGGNEVNVHGYDGAATSALSAAQLRTDHMKAVKLLEHLGIAVGPYRFSFVQNLATNHIGLQQLLVAYGSPLATASLNSFPWYDPYDINRIPVHPRTTAELDTLFASIQTTHGLAIFYTHGIHVDGSNDTTPTLWEYFLSKIRTGVDAGWLEGVTFASLYAGGGTKFRSTHGDLAMDYRDTTGAAASRRVF